MANRTKKRVKSYKGSQKSTLKRARTETNLDEHTSFEYLERLHDPILATVLSYLSVEGPIQSNIFLKLDALNFSLVNKRCRKIILQRGANPYVTSMYNQQKFLESIWREHDGCKIRFLAYFFRRCTRWQTR